MRQITLTGGNTTMTEARLEKQKKKLVELGVMQQDDTLINFLQANYVEQLIGKFGQWRQGWAYFTEQRLIIITGLLEDNVVIPYESIRNLEKSNHGLFPMGITITYENENGKSVTAKISISKRNKWIEFLQEKSHLN